MSPESPKDETFKISLLEGFVVMLTLSILLSLDVYVFDDPVNRLDIGWWGRSSMDGLGVLVLFHIIVVIMVVMGMRVAQKLWRQRKR